MGGCGVATGKTMRKSRTWFRPQSKAEDVGKVVGGWAIIERWM